MSKMLDVSLAEGRCRWGNPSPEETFTARFILYRDRPSVGMERRMSERCVMRQGDALHVYDGEKALFYDVDGNLLGEVLKTEKGDRRLCVGWRGWKAFAQEGAKVRLEDANDNPHAFCCCFAVDGACEVRIVRS